MFSWDFNWVVVMNEEDFKKLLIEIDNMSIKEYNNYHKKAQKMKKSKIFVKNNIEKIN